MKHLKKATRRQKSIISKVGKIDPNGWYVVKETTGILTIANENGELREIKFGNRD